MAPWTFDWSDACWCTALHLEVFDQCRLCSRESKRIFIKCIAGSYAYPVVLFQTLRKGYFLRHERSVVYNNISIIVSQWLLAWLHLYFDSELGDGKNFRILSTIFRDRLHVQDVLKLWISPYIVQHCVTFCSFLWPRPRNALTLKIENS